MTREEVIKSLETAVKNFERYSGDEYGREYDYARVGVDVLEDVLVLLKEYDDALKLMVYQYCTMKPLTLHDEVFHNRFMSAGEAAFRLLGLENGQSTDGVWERWFPNG